MLKKLYLIRHAKAERRVDWNSHGKSDFDRPLRSEGILEFSQFCESFQAFSKLEKVYSSELKRAVQTAELINKFHDIDFETSPEINHGQSPRAILDFLLSRTEKVIGYTGHEPEMSMISRLLLGGDFAIHFKKGTVAVIDLEKEVLESLSYPRLFI